MQVRLGRILCSTMAVLLAVGGAALQAQDGDGSVLGFVYDASTGNPIPQVEVEVTGELTITATTTTEGSFAIDNVPPGTYTVSYKSANHQAVNVEGLEVLAGEIADASTVMSAKGEKTVVDVVATVASSVATQEAMLVERKLASTVSDTISAEEIRGGTSSDAAEAIEKVTGVTTMNDFVFVRGLDPRYSGTTLNNALLASTEPERRVVPLDLFPASLIDNIKVQKTYSPHLPGEFSAGLVQVETTEFPTRPTLSVSYSIGYNDQTQGRTFLDYPGGGRDFFGFDDGTRGLPSVIPSDQRIDRFTFSRNELQEFGHAFSNNWERVPRNLSRPSMSWNIVAGNSFGKLGIVGALTFSNSLRSIFDQERNYYFPNPMAATDPTNAGPPVLQSEFDYDESTEAVRLGGVLNVSYQFNPAHKLSLKNFFSRDTDDNARFYEGYYQDFNTDIRNQRLRFHRAHHPEHPARRRAPVRGAEQQRPDVEHVLLQGHARRAGPAGELADLPAAHRLVHLLRRQPERVSHVQRPQRDDPQSERRHAGALLPGRLQRGGAFRRELFVARAQLQLAALPLQPAQHAGDRPDLGAERPVRA